jgi:hypothetical protein
MYFKILIFNNSDEFNAYLDYRFGLVFVSLEIFPDDGTEDSTEDGTENGTEDGNEDGT